MDYDDETLCKIIKNYYLLRFSLEELEDLKKGGAVLGYVCIYYSSARDSLDFLKSDSIPSSLQKELSLGDFEKKLYDFANTHVEL